MVRSTSTALTDHLPTTLCSEQTLWISRTEHCNLKPDQNSYTNGFLAALFTLLSCFFFYSLKGHSWARWLCSAYKTRDTPSSSRTTAGHTRCAWNAAHTPGRPPGLLARDGPAPLQLLTALIATRKASSAYISAVLIPQ